MQKVVGSSPIIRSLQSRAGRGFCCFTAHATCSSSGSSQPLVSLRRKDRRAVRVPLMASGDGPPLDYFETVQVLNGWPGKLVVVYPIAEPPAGADPSERDFMSGLSVWGTWKHKGDTGAA